MLLGIPGAHGLFSHLPEVFCHHDGKCLHLSVAAHTFLMDFQWLAMDLTTCPTCLAKILPAPNAVFGSTDASHSGMGGIAFVPANVAPQAPYAAAMPCPASDAGCASTADMIAAPQVTADMFAAVHPVPTPLWGPILFALGHVHH